MRAAIVWTILRRCSLRWSPPAPERVALRKRATLGEMRRLPARARLGLTLAMGITAGVAGAATAPACSSNQHPPLPLDPGVVDSGGFVETGPDPKFDVSMDSTINCATDAAGVCSCKEIGQKPTSLYLVLDRSGSMREIVFPATTSKWEVVRTALTDTKAGVLRRLGSRVAIGAARFPGSGAESDGCAVGSQVLDLRTGSKASYDILSTILAAEIPAGGTPTASTLVALTPILAKLPKPAFVLLATDGGPNCGTTSCGTARCIPNIEKATFPTGVCDDSINCCDPAKFKDGIKNCLDSDATRSAVETLAKAGIKVFILGVPGTELYAKDLDDLAIAGGTARDGAPKYYAASDPTQLTDALKTIAAKVVDSCTITLEAPVTDPGITNVLLDSELVPQDPIDGWS